MTNIRNHLNARQNSAKKIGLLVAMLTILSASGLYAENLSSDYLHGRWVVNQQNCSSTDAEYIIFGKNHTFESIRSGKTEITGFWNVNDEILDLHMIASPASFADISGELVGFDGQYFYFKARMVAHNIKENQLEVIGVLGEEIDRAYAVRCK